MNVKQFGQFCSGYPKLPCMYVGLHCNAMKKVNPPPKKKKNYHAMSENIDTHPWDAIGTFEKLGVSKQNSLGQVYICCSKLKVWS